jgi:hypothetical protein
MEEILRPYRASRNLYDRSQRSYIPRGTNPSSTSLHSITLHSGNPPLSKPFLRHPHLKGSTNSQGIDPSLRPEAWKFLLGLYPWSSSSDERKAIRRSKRDEYVRLKAQWWDDLALQEDTWFKDQKSRIGREPSPRKLHPFFKNLPSFFPSNFPSIFLQFSFNFPYNLATIFASVARLLSPIDAYEQRKMCIEQIER